MESLIKLRTLDNYDLVCKLSYPKEFEKLVIYVNGMGPNTYDNTTLYGDKIKFNYHDLFRNEFLKRDIAYLSFNSRGVDVSDIAPLFYQVNDEIYNTNTPSNIIKDVSEIISYFKKLHKNLKIYLLAYSEASMIASQIVEKNKTNVYGLLIVSYFNESYQEILKWQYSGNSLLYNILTSLNIKTREHLISEDLINHPNFFKTIFGDIFFSNLDQNKDGKIDANDLKSYTYPFYECLLNAIASNDENFFNKQFPIKVNCNWFKELFAFNPNKEILPTLDLPIFIFHGGYDSLAPVSGVIDLVNEFNKLNKANLQVAVYNNHDQDLNYLEYITTKKLPNGLNDIFNTVKNS